MAPRNPYGRPPRRPTRAGVLWYGEHWYIGDACKAVGIHINTYNNRKRRHPDWTVIQLLAPGDAPPTQHYEPAPRALLDMIRALSERVAALEARLEPSPLREVA